MSQSIEERMEDKLQEKANKRFTTDDMMKDQCHGIPRYYISQSFEEPQPLEIYIGPVGEIPAEEVDEFMCKQVEKARLKDTRQSRRADSMQGAIEDLKAWYDYTNYSQFTQEVRLLVNTLPNDAELGAAARQYVNV